MKRKIIVGSLLALLAVGVTAAWADSDCDCRQAGQQRQEGHGAMDMRRGPRDGDCHERGARSWKSLDLTDAQQAKVAEIRRAERDQSAAIRDKLRSSFEELRKAEQAAKFDEAVVRSIAAKQAQLLTEMTVSRARTMNRIFSLLTAEQREQAVKFRPPMERRGWGDLPPPLPDCGPGNFAPPPDVMGPGQDDGAW